MKFDVLFLDLTSPSAYESSMLDEKPLGGTEATAIRVAEALAGCGLKVAIVQNWEFEPILGRNEMFFLPFSYLNKVDTDHLVVLRGVAYIHSFPNAKKWMWLHDLPNERLTSWIDTIKEYDITTIGVSEWHKQEIKKYIQSPVEMIYNPVDDKYYLDEDKRPKVDKNLLVWMSSPHKGLETALKLFKQLRQQEPDMRFRIFNPGYLKTQRVNDAGVEFYGETPRQQMLSQVAQSLAVFYPTQFRETFGLIAAEANAVGTPVATNAVAALIETISSEDQLSKTNEELISKIVEWKKKRPIVKGQDRFRLSVIVKQWLKLLGGN